MAELQKFGSRFNLISTSFNFLSFLLSARLSLAIFIRIWYFKKNIVARSLFSDFNFFQFWMEIRAMEER